MNRLPATISAVATHGSISVIDASVGGHNFTATLIGSSDASAWQAGMPVTLLFKETEVALAKNLSGLISMRNRLPARVREIEHGTLLTKVLLEFEGLPISSVITTRSAHALQIAVGDQVEGLVKANEMSVEPESTE